MRCQAEKTFCLQLTLVDQLIKRDFNSEFSTECAGLRDEQVLRYRATTPSKSSLSQTWMKIHEARKFGSQGISKTWQTSISKESKDHLSTPFAVPKITYSSVLLSFTVSRYRPVQTKNDRPSNTASRNFNGWELQCRFRHRNLSWKISKLCLQTAWA